MRYKEILKEFVIRVDNVIVHRNPTPPLVIKALWDSFDRELRGLIIEGKIYIWNSRASTHETMSTALMRDGWIENEDEYSGFYIEPVDHGSPTRMISFQFYTWADDHEIEDDIEARDLLSKFMKRWNS